MKLLLILNLNLIFLWIFNSFYLGSAVVEDDDINKEVDLNFKVSCAGISLIFLLHSLMVNDIFIKTIND